MSVKKTRIVSPVKLPISVKADDVLDWYKKVILSTGTIEEHLPRCEVISTDFGGVRRLEIHTPGLIVKLDTKGWVNVHRRGLPT